MATDLVNRINESTGLKLNIIKSLRTRKGFVYKVEEYGTEMLLKGIELKAGRTRSLQKEAHILKNLDDYTNGLYVNSGEVDEHFWLLRKWVEGKTALKHTSYIRENPQITENKQRFVRDLNQMLKKVIELYDLGYLHGDLQPGHFIIDYNGKFHLIDLELSVNVNDPEAAYRGALVHFVPPETARGMLVNDRKIHLDQISEIYSFGAVAFYMYTEVVPVAYGKSMEDPSFDFPFGEMLQAVAQCRIRSFEQAGVEPFPELERILMRCLERDRTQRYQTFVSLLAALEELL